MKIIDQFQEKTREELCKLLPLQRKKKERKEKEKKRTPCMERNVNLAFYPCFTR